MRRLIPVLLFVLLAMSGCVAPRLYYTPFAQEETMDRTPEFLRAYFTEEAAQKIEHCAVTLIKGDMYLWSPPFSFNKIGGLFRCTPAADDAGPKDPHIFIEAKKGVSTVLAYQSAALVHEYLHAYYFLAWGEEERAAWGRFWREQRAHIPYHLAMETLETEPLEGTLDDPVEMWAYTGQYIVFTTSWQHVPPIIAEHYRGVLRETYLPHVLVTAEALTPENRGETLRAYFTETSTEVLQKVTVEIRNELYIFAGMYFDDGETINDDRIVLYSETQGTPKDTTERKFLVHEELHAAWKRILDEDQQQGWETLLDAHLPLLKERAPEFADRIPSSANERWAYIGAAILSGDRDLDPEEIPPDIREAFREILRDEFLNVGTNSNNSSGQD